MSTSSTAANPSKKPGADIDYGLFLDCVHCGLCTAACPTYAETGDENNSPRGRIYLMRSLIDGRIEMDQHVERYLDLCLDCRACETACPSGVQYGKLIEPFRVDMESARREPQHNDWFHKVVLFGLFPYAKRLRVSLAPARVAQALKLDKFAEHAGLLDLLPSRLAQLVKMLPPAGRERRPLPEFIPAKGPRRARVALFTGCVGDAIFRDTNWATARVLRENGCDVVVPNGQQCCGAIHFHAASSEPARQMADANVAAFDSADVDAVIVNVAGCGAMIKDYPHHWEDDGRARRERFVSKVKDINEFLDELGIVEPQHSVDATATYHDACHLAHAQQIRSAPRRLLSKVPGLTVVDLPESELCCGAAGTYNLTEPEMASRLAARKLENIRSTGAEMVITANAGCILQIARHAVEQGTPLPVIHPIDVLDASYQGRPLKK